MRTERLHLMLCLLVAMVVAPGVARAQVIMDDVPERAQGLDPESHLGETIPLDLELVDAEGRPVTLGEYFQEGRPVVLAMGYYDCPLLCSLVFQGMAKGFAPLEYEAGEDYQIVVVSFDPTNTTDEAFARKTETLEALGTEITPNVRAGWAFHIADESTSRELADAVGYKYRFVESNGEYSHGAMIMMLTPEGVLSRYLIGLNYEPRNVRLALLEASDGQIAAGLGDYFLHLCYQWDPTSEGYVLEAMQVMRIGSVFGAVLLIIFLALLFLGERRRAARRARTQDDAAAAYRSSLGAMG